MLFNSLAYLIFFPIVVLFFFLLPKKFRWILLLLASYYFYGSWKWEYLSLIIFSTIVDFFVAQKLYESQDNFYRKIYLSCSILVNLGVLTTFKYYNFFIDNINIGLQQFGEDSFLLANADWILPMGISFYTFQTMAYTIDVYRKEITPERHFGKFALYVSFFPQLVAGPIERASNLLPQIRDLNAKFNSDRFILGMKQIIWGLFKKVVIADRLSIYVDQIYTNPELYGGANMLIATLFFTFQIYCDFSGYSDMAIGSARILGVQLMDNFRFPYFSQNIQEFWSRWHISLSKWFQDYVYIPLGGNRVKISRFYLNISIVFIVSGFWHGAAWTFIIWGGLHALYYFILSFWQETKWGLFNSRFLSMGITFIATLLAWVFFRADSVSDALYIINGIASIPTWMVDFKLTVRHFGVFSMLIAFLSIFWLALVEYFLLKKDRYTFPTDKFIPMINFTLIIILGVFSGQQFIYFQF